MSTKNHEVIVEKFAERHYVSKFARKYKRAWDVTWSAISEEFKRIDKLIGVASFVETIVDSDDVKICKTEFRIAGPGKSRHASGNRCIIAVHENIVEVHVLLVYNKGDIRGTNETSSWKLLIKNNYPEYRDLL